MNVNSPIDADTPLTLEIIDTLETFRAIRQHWNRLYDLDPESSVFLSWPWLYEAFRKNPMRWSVIAVREPLQNELIAVLPLKYRVHWSRSQKEFHTEIEAGGRLLWSEYTGFLCNPHFESQALKAVVRRLNQMPWSKLSLRYVPQQRRAHSFVSEFAELGYATKFKPYLINNKETDNLVSPQVDLPESFENFLNTQVSANTRQKYNRGKRRFLDTGEYKISIANSETYKSDIDELLTLWMAKWAKLKGQRTAAAVAENYRSILETAFEQNLLFLPVLRKSSRVLGALGHIVDAKNGTVHYIVAGRNVEETSPFIGPALHFFSIEWAIRHDHICYDFCHGNEAFKYSYGAIDTNTLYFEVRRKSGDTVGAFDSICSSMALNRIDRFLRAGKIEEARIGCQQLSSELG